MNPAKEQILEAQLVLGDCRREALFALMSDIKETTILKGLLKRLGDLEEAIEAISDALSKPCATGELPCVRRGL